MINFTIQKNEDNFPAMAQIMCSTDPWITLKIPYDRSLAGLKGEGKEVYTIFDDDKVIGVIVLQITGSFRIYLQTICISPQSRGKGVGHKAIKFLEERIFAQSPNFFLCVSSFNTEAQKFYLSQGFELVGMIKDFVLEGYDELLLRKTCGSFTSFTPKNNNR